LSAVPEAPSGLTATPTATELRLAWEPSGGTLGYLLERTELAPEPLPLDDVEAPFGPATAGPPPPMAPLGPTTYNVYRVRDPLPDGASEPVTVPAGAAAAAPVSKWNLPPPSPINPAPLPQLSAVDSVQFDRRTCYTVRAVRAGAEGPASEPRCLTPVDRFAPAPPQLLAAVATANGINLIWAPNSEPDVAGYLVLRGVPGDATLQTLTPTPIAEARYTDTAVMPGTRYVYAVRAVDSQPAPNVSVESERVEETAR
jgi:hypothetical protein